MRGRTLRIVNASPNEASSAMILIPDGRSTMGSERFYPEERPRRSIEAAAFRIDAHPVTNDEFATFVADTGWITVAERPLDPADYPGADPALLHPGGVVFVAPPGPVLLDDPSRWWAYVPGASWRHPLGPDSDLSGKGDHPVVQVGFPDALAYAEWRGVRLPTETEWERAARGGIDAEYPWGDDPYPGGRQMANTWQGQFPWENLALDGWTGTSPVRTYPANGYGLFDVAGNVWEWTTDWWSAGSDGSAAAASAAAAAAAAAEAAGGSCCSGGGVGPTTELDAAPANALADAEPCSAVTSSVRGSDADSDAVAERASALPGERYGRKVIKGGSHLCAPSYCHRFRPAARQPEAIDTSTSHLGFRCAADV